MIADTDPDFCEMLREELARRVPAAQVDCVTDGLELLRCAEAQMPEVIVLNVLLPGRDGLAIMQTIRGMERFSQPEFIVLSGYFSSQIHTDLCRMRPAYYTALPCDISLLSDRIMRCCSHVVYQQSRREADDDERIMRLLREMGLSMRCKGFRYAREALRRIADMQEEQISVTKVIYPAVATTFRTTAVNVERAIRSAILAAWQNDGCLRQQELFRSRPTNSEFLAVLAEVLRQERRRNTKQDELEG